jgi:hypothetical protein
VVGTIVARNYLAYAMVLEASVREHDPDVDVVTLLVDGTEDDRVQPGPGRIVLPGDLGLSPDELEPMILMYSVMELSTALKPALLRHLLSTGYRVAAYLDPDVYAVGSLRSVFDAAQEHAIALTPHALRPIPRDGLEIAERSIMRAGIFNLGFIAVAERAGEFLDWWHTRLRTDAVVDFAAAMFTDQRWADWIPALFEHSVLRDPGLNVAYWNAHERPLTTAADGQVLADGRPLRFVHFSGFDPARPGALSKHTGRYPRVLLSDAPVLAQLCAEYAERLVAAGHLERRSAPYGFDTIDGLRPLTAELRNVYRSALVGELPFSAPPTRPLTAPAEVEAWLETPSRVAPWTELCPADYIAWMSTEALRERHTDPLVTSAAALRAQLHPATGPLPSASAALALVSATGRRTSRWTVVAGGGIEPAGEVRELAARLHERLLAVGLDADLLVARRVHRTRYARWVSSGATQEALPDNVLVCVDGDRISLTDLALQAQGVPGVRVAVWLTADPSGIHGYKEQLDGFDEVWAVSAEVEEALRAVTSARVARLRLPARAGDPAAARDVTGDAAARVVVELDAHGSADRQRLDLAVAAYLVAFEEGDGHRLEIWSRYGELFRSDLDHARGLAARRGDVHLRVEEDARPAPFEAGDVVLAVDPTMRVGLTAVDAIVQGASVLTTGSRLAGLAGVVAPGLVRVDAVGEAPTLEELAAALAAGVGQDVDASFDETRLAGTPAEVLAAAAAAAGRRVGRSELRHLRPLEDEIDRLRAEIAWFTAERAALEQTKIFRYTRRLRALYAALHRGGRAAD